MEGETNFSQIAPPIFDGDNYDLWAVKMESYLEALDLWEAVEEDYEVPPPPNNPTMAQMRLHKEKKTKKAKAKSCLFAGVSKDGERDDGGEVVELERQSRYDLVFFFFK
jgi:hypothetical protein